MKKLSFLIIFLLLAVSFAFYPRTAEAKSYIKSYKRSSGTSVRPHVRYKADGYKFNNYKYRPDRGYRR
jgi:hypothetical protein